MTRVLVACDQPVSRMNLKTVLEKEGFAVTIASDGKSALHELKSRDYAFELIITGLMLPHANGLEIISRIRIRSPRHIPVIILNGLVEEHTEASPTNSSDINYARPLPAAELMLHVHSLLSAQVQNAV